MKVTLSDEDLVRSFVQTRHAAYFEALYDRHQRYVLRLCMQYVNNQHDAHDLAQDAFVRVYKQAASYKGQSSFQSWLQAITRNTCIDYLRRRKVRFVAQHDIVALYPATFDEDPTELEGLHWRLNVLETALSRLSTDDAQMLTRHYQDQVPLRDLARQQQISDGAAKMRLLRARGRLREAYASSQQPLH